MSFLVLCPTRGRPDAARETLASFQETRELSDTQLLFVVNADEDQEIYRGMPTFVVPRQDWMNDVLRLMVEHILLVGPPDYLGFIGDDNRFRTPGWDSRVVEVLEDRGGGFAYGNDLGRFDIPSHVFVSSNIVRALGWFGLPGAHHLYLDNTWGHLGEGADCLYFIPDLIIEHLHPLFGKGEMDESYLSSSSHEVFAHDLATYNRWLEEDAERDIQTVRDIVGT
jgi:hypothetical protein